MHQKVYYTQAAFALKKMAYAKGSTNVLKLSIDKNKSFLYFHQHRL